jgi:hypothetical protein
MMSRNAAARMAFQNLESWSSLSKLLKKKAKPETMIMIPSGVDMIFLLGRINPVPTV